MTEETFDFVVAGRWPTGEMSIYTYHRQIQHGSMADATWFLDYVKGRNSEMDYKIYKIKYEEIVMPETVYNIYKSSYEEIDGKL